MKIAVFCCVATAIAASISSGIDLREELESQITAADLKADESWLKLKNADEVAQRRNELRREVLSVLGKFPERTPLKAKVTGKIDKRDYRLEKIIYESRPGVYVSGVLFLPDARKYAAPYPAYMFCSGHSDNGKAAEAYLKCGMLGALNGYAVFMTDPVGQGEREQGAGVRNSEEHVRLGALATLVGQSQTGIMLWDLMRGVDYLETRADIRKDQIGCTGNSGGGTMSSYLGAIDWRMRAAAPSCYISSIREVIKACGPQDCEQNLFGQLAFGFNHLGLMMLNDNAWCLNLARADFFPYAGSLSTLAAAKRVAKIAGKGEDYFESVSAEGGHGLSEDHRQGIIRWFNRWLLNEPNRELITTDYAQLVTEREVLASPSGNVRELLGYRSYYDCLKDDLVALREQRPLDAKVRDKMAARLAGVCAQGASEEIAAKQGVSPTEYVISIGDEIVAKRVVEEERAKGVKAEVVWLKAANSAEWKKPKRSGKLSYYGRRADDEELAVELFLMGKTLVGERANELLRMAAAERAKTGVAPKIVAIGRAAIPVAFACAADRKAFTAVSIVGAAEAWEEAINNHSLVSFADLVPNALSVCDWPDLLDNAEFSPIDTVWTFGNHEPITMYRRIGKKSTGGIEGSALWLEDWHHWFDSRECTSLMKSLGLNAMHSRFFKGMGWQVEKNDFAAVRGFVENCHADGVAALAYVQFLSLYYETFGKEVPNLENWSNRGADGKIGTYGGQYQRWLPCITSPEFESYLYRMTDIALREGKFDGIMFDNIFVAPCYCERCEKLFREWLERRNDAPSALGFAGYDCVRQPRIANVSAYGEIQDPLERLWIEWRVELLNSFFARLRAHIKSVNPIATVCANTGAVRSRNSAKMLSRDMTSLASTLDLALGQNGNVPRVDKGVIINRVRDIKFLRACGKTDLSLCDGDAGLEVGDERAYLLPLLEDAAFGGVPADRTIIKPCRNEGFIDRKQLEFRRPLIKKFKNMLAENRQQLSSPIYEPIRIFYPVRGIRFSETAYRGVFGAEEVLLRRHLPFGYVISRPDEKPIIPEDCEILLVADQKCLSDNEIAAISEWARHGGRLILAGDCGGWDDWNRQRLRSPLDDLKTLPNVKTIGSLAAKLMNNCSWEYRVQRPADGGDMLLAQLKKLNWQLPYRIEDLPETTFVETRRINGGYWLFFVNYDVAKPPFSFRVNDNEHTISSHAMVFVNN